MKKLPEKLDDMPRVALAHLPTPVEAMGNLAAALGRGGGLYVKRDDCTGLAFGGNKIRQLEFYLGEARAEGAARLGMDCHVQLEERVAGKTGEYRTSGNVLLDRMLGATIHLYPEGEDEEGADRRVREIADDLKAAGRKTYVVPLAPGHKPLGALGYVVAAREILGQIDRAREAGPDYGIMFLHTGGTPGAFAYSESLTAELEKLRAGK